MTTPTHGPPPPGEPLPSKPATPAPGREVDPYGQSGRPWDFSYHEQPPPSKAMAGWALALAILNCSGIGWIISLGLAIVVLARCRDGRSHGKGLAIAAIVIDGIWLLVAAGLVVGGVVTEWSQLNAETRA